jgi:hypothetical protein
MDETAAFDIDGFIFFEASMQVVRIVTSAWQWQNFWFLRIFWRKVRRECEELETPIYRTHRSNAD